MWTGDWTVSDSPLYIGFFFCFLCTTDSSPELKHSYSHHLNQFSFHIRPQCGPKLLELWSNISTGKSSTCLRRSQQGFIYIYCIYKTQKVATLKMPRHRFTKNYKDGTRKVKKQPLKVWPDLFQIKGRSNFYYSRNIKKSLQMRQEAPYCQNFTLS